MEIQLLGTSAAEGYPGVFCNCKACEQARQLGGKDIRTRSGAIINDSLKIDLSADTYHHAVTNHLNLGDVTHLIFTHSHSDHLYLNELRNRLPVYAHQVKSPLKIYGNEKVISMCAAVLGSSSDRFELHEILPFQAYEMGEFIITPLLADHDPEETCFIFHIQKADLQYLYGNDTGWFPEETWKWLEDKKLNIATLDCTNGLIPERRNHLNIDAVKDIKRIFTEKNIVDHTSRVIATHFSHNIHLTHRELEEQLNPYAIEVAYDGMILSV